VNALFVQKVGAGRHGYAGHRKHGRAADALVNVCQQGTSEGEEHQRAAEELTNAAKKECAKNFWVKDELLILGLRPVEQDSQ